MRKNPLAERIRRLLAAAPGAGSLTVVIRHRGAPDDRKAIDAGDIARVTAASLVLGDGTEVPLHRVIELQVKGDTTWSRRA